MKLTAFVLMFVSVGLAWTLARRADQIQAEKKIVEAKLVEVTEGRDLCNSDFMRLSNDLNTEQALHKDTQKELAAIRSRVVAAELHAQPCPQVCNVDCRDVHFAVAFAAKCAATAGDMLEILGKPGEKP